ncbi:MAG: RhuM family protein [Flavobacteriales bacterium]
MEGATIAKFATIQTQDSRGASREIEHYNLDTIISVGYRGNFKCATRSCQWAIYPIA